MALSHTDTDIQSLVVNKFDNVSDFEAAKSQSLIGENDISIIDGGIQSDWNQDDSSERDYVKNKPTIPTTVSELSDTEITSPSDGQTLQYNATAQKWKNANPIRTHIYAVDDMICFGGQYFLKNANSLSNDDIAFVFRDNESGDKKYLPYADADSIRYVDTSLYTLQPFVRFTRGKKGRNVAIGAGVQTDIWAVYNRYRIHCDTSASGGFSWSITINGTSHSGSASWSAGETLSSIYSQLTTGISYLTFSFVEGEDFIRVLTGGYSDSTFTISNATGTVLDDLSLYVKIDGVQQAESHRTWQAMNVNTMFPSLGFLPSNSKQYAKNGYNLSYICGGNETRYKEYYNANGSTSYVSESSVAARMKETTFNGLNNSGVAEQQALYDKYNGSWNAYMEASMINIDDTHTDGIEYQSYDNGDEQTSLLASVTTMDFDGSYIPAFPAASNCNAITASVALTGRCHMPTEHEIAVFMRDSKFDAINAAFNVLSANGIQCTQLSKTSYYWSVARSNNIYAWFYYGSHGYVSGYTLSGLFSVRPLAYLD